MLQVKQVPVHTTHNSGIYCIECVVPVGTSLVPAWNNSSGWNVSPEFRRDITRELYELHSASDASRSDGLETKHVTG